MPDPTHGPYGTPPLDTFPGPDGDPGSNWVTAFVSGTSPAAILNNHLDVTGGGPSSARYSSLPLTPNSECWAFFYSSNDGHLFLRSTAAVGGAGDHAYELWCDNALMYIYRWDGASVVTLARANSAASITGWNAFTAIGSLLQGWRWNGSRWILVVTVVDATYAAAGYLGAKTQGYYLDNFGGGWVRSQFGDGVNSWKPNEKLELAFGHGPRDVLTDADWIEMNDLP